MNLYNVVGLLLRILCNRPQWCHSDRLLHFTYTLFLLGLFFFHSTCWHFWSLNLNLKCSNRSMKSYVKWFFKNYCLYNLSKPSLKAFWFQFLVHITVHLKGKNISKESWFINAIVMFIFYWNWRSLWFRLNLAFDS